MIRKFHTTKQACRSLLRKTQLIQTKKDRPDRRCSQMNLIFIFSKILSKNKNILVVVVVVVAVRLRDDQHVSICCKFEAKNVRI